MAEALVLPNIYALVHPAGDLSKLFLQERWKPDSDPINSGKLELPGGKWRAREPILDCLKREVNEETGLRITKVNHVIREHANALGHRVQTAQPLYVSQMIDGPYPSMLLVFSVEADGEPSVRGDGARNGRWWSIDEIDAFIKSEPN